MTIDFTSAAKAYASTNRMIGGVAGDAKSGESFGKLLQNAADYALTTTLYKQNIALFKTALDNG